MLGAALQQCLYCAFGSDPLELQCLRGAIDFQDPDLEMHLASLRGVADASAALEARHARAQASIAAFNASLSARVAVVRGAEAPAPQEAASYPKIAAHAGKIRESCDFKAGAIDTSRLLECSEIASLALPAPPVLSAASLRRLAKEAALCGGVVVVDVFAGESTLGLIEVTVAGHDDSAQGLELQFTR